MRSECQGMVLVRADLLSVENCVLPSVQIPHPLSPGVTRDNRQKYVEANVDDLR